MPNTPCVFPFKYGEGGKTYYGCADEGWGVSPSSHESHTVNCFRVQTLSDTPVLAFFGHFLDLFRAFYNLMILEKLTPQISP